MRKRKPKEYEYFSCKLDKKVSEKLNEVSEETGVPKTVLVEKALKEYFEKHYEKEG